MTILHPMRRRTDPERFDLYTRGSLYVLLATTPFVGVAGVTEVAEPAVILAYLLGLVVQAALAIGMTSVALRQFLGGPRVPTGWYLALGVVTAAVTGIAVLTLPLAEGLSGRTGALILALGMPLVAVSPVVRTRTLVVATLALAAVTTASYTLPRPVDEDFPAGQLFAAALTTTIVVGAMVSTFR
ncbi:hypothetical protein PU560_02700, partial [Georgenia sp. 10Sc9-8]|nr:hypothetical protein [Georgenia halotolerans]